MKQTYLLVFLSGITGCTGTSDSSSETTDDPTTPTVAPTLPTGTSDTSNTDTNPPDTGSTPLDTDTGTTSKGPTCSGTFPATWISGGPACPGEPPLQVHHYDDDTVLLRQSLCTSFEAPFLYLLFGENRALLQDTGDGGIPLVSTVQGLIADYEAQTGHDIQELVVLNSHGHGDHVAANGAFAQQAETTVVGTSVSALTTYFNLSWPDGAAEIDLGGRIIDVLPIPGHQSAHTALYDRSRGLLFTGDTLYPGRLYISDFGAYRESIEKLVDFTATRLTCHVLGTHVEMTTTAGEDFPFGATHHPDEHVLQLERDHLVELSAALTAMGNNPVYEVHDDFIIFP